MTKTHTSDCTSHTHCAILHTYPYSASMLKFLSILLTAALAATGATPNEQERSPFYYNGSYDNENAYIAHAGGVYPFIYSNCKEAVEDALKRGFKFIELDLLPSDDGQLIAAHDRTSFGILTATLFVGPRKLLAAEAGKLKVLNKFTVLTGKDIYRIMQENPQMVLVTDKINDYELLLKEIPLPERMIVECFSIEDVQRARAAGIKHVAYCADTFEKLHAAIQHKLNMITVCLDDIHDNDLFLAYLRRLHREGVCIMAYGCITTDIPGYIQFHLGRTCSKFYINCADSFRGGKPIKH